MSKRKGEDSPSHTVEKKAKISEIPSDTKEGKPKTNTNKKKKKKLQHTRATQKPFKCPVPECKRMFAHLRNLFGHFGTSLSTPKVPLTHRRIVSLPATMDKFGIEYDDPTQKPKSTNKVMLYTQDVQGHVRLFDWPAVSSGLEVCGQHYDENKCYQQMLKKQKELDTKFSVCMVVESGSSVMSKVHTSIVVEEEQKPPSDDDDQTDHKHSDEFDSTMNDLSTYHRRLIEQDRSDAEARLKRFREEQQLDSTHLESLVRQQQETDMQMDSYKKAMSARNKQMAKQEMRIQTADRALAQFSQSDE